MFMVEAALLGFAASLLGMVLGGVLSTYFVKVLLRFEIGPRVARRFSTLTVVETCIMAQMVALLARWLPTRSAAQLDVVEALSYEWARKARRSACARTAAQL